MGEEKSRRKDKGPEPEGFEAGRIFGLLKRRDPSLYEEIISIMESERLEPSDIIREAFALYRDYKYMIGIDPRALAYAFRLVQVLQQRVIEMMVFSMDYYSRLVGAGPEQIAETVAKKIAEDLKKTQETSKGGLPEDIKGRLMSLTMNTVMRMLETMVTSLPRPPLTPQSATATSAEPARKPKIILGSPERSESKEEAEKGPE